MSLDVDALFARRLTDALDCLPVWPPVLTPVQLGDYGVTAGGAFRRLGNVTEFGASFAVERGQPSRLELASTDVRLLRFAGAAQVASFHGLGSASGRVAFEFGRGAGFVLRCARVERRQIADLAGLARRLLDARTADGRTWRPLAWRLVWQVVGGDDVLFLAAGDAGARIELGGGAESLQRFDGGSGGFGLSVARRTGLALEIVGGAGPIGYGLARVRLRGGVKFFGGDGSDDEDDAWVERLPADAALAEDPNASGSEE
jgi:hypothetical protein